MKWLLKHTGYTCRAKIVGTTRVESTVVKWLMKQGSTQCRVGRDGFDEAMEKVTRKANMCVSTTYFSFSSVGRKRVL